MSHNFIKQSDETKVCSWCGDEKGLDPERCCPYSQGVQADIGVRATVAPHAEANEIVRALHALSLDVKALTTISATPKAAFEKTLHSLSLDMKAMTTKSVSFQLDLKDIKQQTKVAFKSLTPSAACKSENENEFLLLVEGLKLAHTPYLSSLVEPYTGPELVRYAQRKLSFQWTDLSSASKYSAQDEVEEIDVAGNDEKVLERVSYKPFMQYLETLNLPSADVSEGARCHKKNLFDSRVFTLRKGTSFSSASLRITAQEPVLIQCIRGGTDIIIVRENCIDSVTYTKAHVRVAIEIKTVKGMKSVDSALREAVVQLVGLNTQNVEVSPVVLLTNFVGKHDVLYLALGSDPAIDLKYHLHITQFKTLESALEFAEDQSLHEPISLHFGRIHTPPVSENGEEEESDV